MFPLTSDILKFLIVGVNYFTKWIEAKVLAKIMTEKNVSFLLKKIMYKYGFPGAIVSDNRT